MLGLLLVVIAVTVIVALALDIAYFLGERGYFNKGTARSQKTPVRH